MIIGILVSTTGAAAIFGGELMALAPIVWPRKRIAKHRFLTGLGIMAAGVATLCFGMSLLIT